ncbi:DUF5320 domain-containing protein [Phosphitispora sp. TUW77]|uniref:DUF5320 domain-containing protein n=1 Tax=Phosphitispora sp. TUW77 TaxID=3152361 RepID=UPI003AB778F6
MPNRDGTGPTGNSGLVRGLGRGLGLGLRMGLGYGCRRGYRFYAERLAGLTDKQLLIEEKELLQGRIDDISKQLEGLSEGDK